MSDYRLTAAPIIKEFLNYHEVIKNHSANTVDAYYSDVKKFIYFLKMRANEPTDSEMIDIDTLGAVTKTDIYDYVTWLRRDQNLDTSTRQRRLAAIRSLYSYLTVKKDYLKENPTVGIDNPKKRQKLPVHMTKSEADILLDAVGGQFELRNRMMLVIFLTCGLRVSELVGLDINSVLEDRIKVLGKGGKERMVYLSKFSQEQMKDYLAYRKEITAKPGHEKALFLSQRNTRITTRGVQKMVDTQLKRAGLDASALSPHKLRHTAATLLLQNGVDIRVLQDMLGHAQLGTTQIYTHVDAVDLKIASEASPIGKKD